MRRAFLFRNKKAFGFLSLILAVAIIGFMMWFMLKRYVGESPTPTSYQQVPEEVMEKHGVDTSSDMAVLQSLKKQIKVIEQQQVNRPQELMGQIDEMSP